MHSIDSPQAREKLTPRGPILSPEEYNALMSEFPLETTHQPLTSGQIADKLKKLEFNLMVLVGLTLGVILVVIK
jgi:hypothetical protein